MADQVTESNVWGVNTDGEIVAVGGKGPKTVANYIDTLGNPKDDLNRVVINAPGLAMGEYTLATLPNAATVAVGTEAIVVDQDRQRMYSTGSEWLPVGGGGGDGGSTNLGFSRTASTVTVTSSTGTDAALPAATTTDADVMPAADKVKLDGIATGATQNQSDATLLSRANHTGTQTAATISDFNTAVRANRLDQMAAPTAAVAMGSQRITGLADPASAQDAATRAYVDGLAVNLGKRQRVRAATTANITIATALNAGDALDGVTLAAGDQVLVKNQTAQAENGVYVVGPTPARAAEFDTYAEHPGSLIVVAEGTTQADTVWLCTSNDGGTLGSTAIVFGQSGTSGALLAASNLSDLSNVATARTNLQISATNTPVTDAGGYYAGANVEAVLQEIAANYSRVLASVSITADTALTRTAHGNRLLVVNSATPVVLTIEDDTTGAWQADDGFEVLVLGAGSVTVQGDGTSAISIPSTYRALTRQGELSAWVRGAANSWRGGLPNFASLTVANQYAASQAVTDTLLTISGGSVATNAALGNGFMVAATSNFTLANPTNLANGQILSWRVTQDANGSRVATYGSKFRFAGGAAVGGVLSTAANAVDVITGKYYADTDTILCVVSKAFAA